MSASGLPFMPMCFLDFLIKNITVGDVGCHFSFFFLLNFFLSPPALTTVSVPFDGGPMSLCFSLLSGSFFVLFMFDVSKVKSCDGSLYYRIVNNSGFFNLVSFFSFSRFQKSSLIPECSLIPNCFWQLTLQRTALFQLSDRALTSTSSCLLFRK